MFEKYSMQSNVLDKKKKWIKKNDRINVLILYLNVVAYSNPFILTPQIMRKFPFIQ